MVFLILIGLTLKILGPFLLVVSGVIVLTKPARWWLWMLWWILVILNLPAAFYGGVFLLCMAFPRLEKVNPNLGVALILGSVALVLAGLFFLYKASPTTAKAGVIRPKTDTS